MASSTTPGPAEGSAPSTPSVPAPPPPPQQASHATPPQIPRPPPASSHPASGGQHYSLKWNNHQSHVLSAFELLLQNDQLVDCTLVCEDSNIKAHKVVLSACSPYFQKIFVENPCKHPVIVLKDIRGWEVQCIVDFMYKGETSVPETQLTSLIKAAESLKVRGLTSNEQSATATGGASGVRPGSQSELFRFSTSSDSTKSRHASPMPSAAQLVTMGINGYHQHSAPRGYSPSPVRGGYNTPSMPGSAHEDHHQSKVPHMTGSHSNQSSPMSLTNHLEDRDAHPHHRDRSSGPSNRSSPGPSGSGSSSGPPRRKQARPRRRSGDSIGNESVNLSKADSPPLGASAASSGEGHFRKTTTHGGDAHMEDAAPENLSMKRPSSSPAINLVKTERLLEENGRSTADHLRPTSSDHMNGGVHTSTAVAAGLLRSLHHSREREQGPPKPPTPSFRPGSTDGGPPGPPGAPIFPGRLHHLQEHEARVEALQALNFMAQGGGLPPPFPPPPPGHPLVPGPPPHNGVPHPGPNRSALTPSSLANLAAASAAVVAGARPGSNPAPGTAFPGRSAGSTPSSRRSSDFHLGRGQKGQHSAPRGGPPRSWTNDELTNALENVWNKKMTTSQASRQFGIPYNSLLMYVRGKYGKSLKLDQLKERTPAAKDSLNTIGNSRSTPKEKMLAKARFGNGDKTSGRKGGSKNAGLPTMVPCGKIEAMNTGLLAARSMSFAIPGTGPGPNGAFATPGINGSTGSGSASDVSPGSSGTAASISPNGLNAVAAAGFVPNDGGIENNRIREILASFHQNQAQTRERLRLLETYAPPEQLQLLRPLFERQIAEMAAAASSYPQAAVAAAAAAAAAAPAEAVGSSGSPTTNGSGAEVGVRNNIAEDKDEESPLDVAEKEREIQDLFMHAEAEKQRRLLGLPDEEPIEEDEDVDVDVDVDDNEEDLERAEEDDDEPEESKMMEEVVEEPANDDDDVDEDQENDENVATDANTDTKSRRFSGSGDVIQKSQELTKSMNGDISTT